MRIRRMLYDINEFVIPGTFLLANHMPHIDGVYGVSDTFCMGDDLYTYVQVVEKFERKQGPWPICFDMDKLLL